MKIFFLSLSLFITCFSISNMSKAQSYTSVSKTCGACGGIVSTNARVGQRCPHCGVIWGRENSHTTTTSQKTQFPTSTSSYDADYMLEMSSTTANSNLRSAPNSTATVLGIISKNESIIITKRRGDWVKVSFTGNFIANNGGFIKNYIGWLHVSCVVL